MLRIGVMHGAHYIVKGDDDYCPDMEKIKKVIEDAKFPKYAYIAGVVWDKAVRIQTFRAMPDSFKSFCARATMSLHGQPYCLHRGPHEHNDRHTQYYEIQKGFDGKFVPYYTGGVYVLTFSLAKLITFADFNYASMYPMCVMYGIW